MRARILNASAGSGKTYQLAYKYVHDVIEQPTLYRHILAVTFTNKATEEMKSRILKEIHLLASGAQSSYMENLCRELELDAQTIRKRAVEVRSRILHDYSRFTVLTIDTFFQRILRAFIKELGIDLNYNVEIETDTVLSKSADTLIEQITTDQELKQWLIDFVQERIDAGKKWDIREGVLALGNEIFKESNKETLAVQQSKESLKRIIDRAIGNGEAAKQALQQLATEAVEAIAAAGASVEDFPYKKTSMAAYFYALAAGEIKPYGERVAKACHQDEAWGKPQSLSQQLRPQLQPRLQQLCARYDENLRRWNTCDLLRENYRSFALLTDLYANVQKLCNEQSVMLLSETKYRLSEFVKHNDAPFIYEKVGNRFDRFMIDEFQDTSVKEWENFLPLLNNALSQSDKTSVLIVGDIKQSIYRWRGGDWKILHSEAARALGKENTEVVNLKENYRSLPMIVEFNNRIMGRLVDADNAVLNKELSAAAEAGDLPQQSVMALCNTLANAYDHHEQIPRRKAQTEGYVSIATFEQEPPVVERICQLIDRGFSPSQILILVRSATDGAKVAASLLAFKRTNEEARYQFDVMTQEALIVGKAPVCGFVVAALRLALNSEDSISRAIYNHYLGVPFEEPLDEQTQLFFRSIRLLSPEEAFEQIVIRHKLQDRNAETAYLQAIHEQVIAFCNNKIADISLFLQWWEDQGSTRSLSVERSERAVEILTVHKAKGLEKAAVIIPYCNWKLDPKPSGMTANIVWAEPHGTEIDEIGRFPVRFKSTMSASGFSAEYYREKVFSHVDNVNLLYVALTRAAESLHIFIPQKRETTVGELLRTSMEADAETSQVTVGELTGSYTQTEQGELFEFGTFADPVDSGNDTTRAHHLVLDHYPTSQADLRLRLPSQRYFETESAPDLSPRNYGIWMHRIFEHATDQAQIEQAIRQLAADSVISNNEVQTLEQMIGEALTNPIVKEWFGGAWDLVRNENDIIVPRSSTIRRPDRVMIAGKRAVVVDYKFGALNTQRYSRQICDYMQLLEEMGYTQVEGYIWYVKLGSIERVERT